MGNVWRWFDPVRAVGEKLPIGDTSKRNKPDISVCEAGQVQFMAKDVRESVSTNNGTNGVMHGLR